MSKARSTTRHTPPSVRPSADLQAGDAPLPAAPEPPEVAGGKRKPANGLLVAFNALVLVVWGGLSYASLLYDLEDAWLMLAATGFLVVAMTIITPAYLAGWLDRPQRVGRTGLPDEPPTAGERAETPEPVEADVTRG